MKTNSRHADPLFLMQSSCRVHAGTNSPHEQLMQSLILCRCRVDLNTQRSCSAQAPHAQSGSSHVPHDLCMQRVRLCIRRCCSAWAPVSMRSAYRKWGGSNELCMQRVRLCMLKSGSTQAPLVSSGSLYADKLFRTSSTLQSGALHKKNLLCMSSTWDEWVSACWDVAPSKFHMHRVGLCTWSGFAQAPCGEWGLIYTKRSGSTQAPHASDRSMYPEKCSACTISKMQTRSERSALLSFHIFA